MNDLILTSRYPEDNGLFFFEVQFLLTILDFPFFKG